MIFILNYRGKSFISHAIKTITWSKYSHTAIADDTGRTVEAWHKGGVRDSPSPWTLHKAGTPIMVYGLDVDEASASFILWQMLKLKGAKYDFRALLGFLPGLRWMWKNKVSAWFCSHAVAFACQKGQVALFSPQTPLYKISPGMIDTSAQIRELGVVTDLQEYLELISIMRRR